MLNLKRTLLAGAVLTALCASVFAAEPADNSASQPTMRERVNAILSDGGTTDNDRAPRGEKRRPKLTPEQREKLAQRRAEWEKMTPEQRREAREKWQKEWQERHEEYAKAAMAKLSDEQKAEVEAFIKEDIAQRQERRAKLDGMTPEQREAVRANLPLHHKEWRGHRGGYRHWRDGERYRGWRHDDRHWGGPGPRHGGPRPDCPAFD
ncbi:MAG: hypothetical protein Q4E64_00410 [Phascolarctobacterium sp.]|uniref:DUF3106 domain-containing protein n=1 Tax=Phascolarctobacterium sp. TaxID=2049039 RepID=UPI0026DB7801|nr:DUF3106 domain-containing protein [Phascolarctobacterium sp.]MDO4920282.1 hypothetical protein [Phascolarctobacterium sp.]